MPFVKRDSSGAIIALYSDQTTDAHEHLPAHDEEVLSFLLSGEADEEGAKSYLSYTDSDVTRIIEDVVDLLIKKNLIMLTELPLAAQQKLNLRKRLRNKYLAENPLLSEDHLI